VAEVALFPIPRSVTFPGVPCLLHVFEPRYRKMVTHCLEHSMLMGVCHTTRVVHAVDNLQTHEEALNSNQATYKPCEIFSAGPVELLQELDDGRMAIRVNVDRRLLLKVEIQTLPFSIWQCEELPDHELDAAELPDLDQTRQKIVQRLLAITFREKALQVELSREHWQKMSASQFSFEINGLLEFDPEFRQQLLELRHPQQRLSTLLSLLNTIA
jgi:Lon protease-like protein